MSEEEVKRKKMVRKAHRAVLTRTIGQVREILEKEDRDMDRLRYKKSVLIEKRDVLKTLDQGILSLTSDEELVEEMKRADEVMENLELTIVLIDSTVESSVHVATPTIMGVSPPLEEPTTITDARVLPSVPVATTSSGITVAASEGESVVGGSVSVPITETLTTTTPLR